MRVGVEGTGRLSVRLRFSVRVRVRVKARVSYLRCVGPPLTAALLQAYHYYTPNTHPPLPLTHPYSYLRLYPTPDLTLHLTLIT